MNLDGVIEGGADPRRGRFIDGDQARTSQHPSIWTDAASTYDVLDRVAKSSMVKSPTDSSASRPTQRACKTFAIVSA